MQFSALQANRKVLPEIAMRRTSNRALCGLIVEGITDRKFFEKFISADRCAVLPVGGKPQVVTTIQEALTSRLPGVLGVVDGDVDHFLGKPKPAGNIFRTDSTDVESLMFASPAFVHLFRETMLRDGDARSGETIVKMAEKARSLIVGAAFQIGLIRCAAAQAGMGINFSNLAYNTFVNNLTCAIDMEICLRAVLALPRGKLDDDAAQKAIVTVLKLHAAHNVWEVVRGHDLTRIAAICSESLLGRKLDRAEVEQGMRLAYDAEELQKTAIYADIEDWATHNKPFVVWKHLPTTPSLSSENAVD